QNLITNGHTNANDSDQSNYQITASSSTENKTSITIKLNHSPVKNSDKKLIKKEAKQKKSQSKLVEHKTPKAKKACNMTSSSSYATNRKIIESRICNLLICSV